MFIYHKLFLMLLFVLQFVVILIFSFIFYDLHFACRFGRVCLNWVELRETTFIFIYIYACF